METGDLNSELELARSAPSTSSREPVQEGGEESGVLLTPPENGSGAEAGKHSRLEAGLSDSVSCN